MSEHCPCCSVMVVKDLNRWFKEKWVDVSRKDKDGKHPPCGRKKAKTSSKGYPKCRPSVKVSSKTPKTSGSMTEGQKRAATKRKRSKKQGVGGKPTVVKGDELHKRAMSPEAKRHKLEYDTKYESTPERLKYREELKRERRRRGIDGKGGPDMSHTKEHTLVAEDPHTNRARHFKERGTLKGDPMELAWLLLKFDLDQRSPDDMDDLERREEELMRQFNRQRTPEQMLSRGQLRRLEQGRPARGQSQQVAGSTGGKEHLAERRFQRFLAEQREKAHRNLNANINAVESHPGQGPDELQNNNFNRIRDLSRTVHGTHGDIYNRKTYGTPPLEAMQERDRMKNAVVNFEFVHPKIHEARSNDEFIQMQRLADQLGNLGLIPPTPEIQQLPEDKGSPTLWNNDLTEIFDYSPRVHVAFSPQAGIEGYSRSQEPTPTFQGIPFRTEEDSLFGEPFMTGEPMNLAFRLLKGEL